MFDSNELLEVFLTEGRELTEVLEQGLLQLEQHCDHIDAEAINALFRAAHTIKGSAGVVGLDDVVGFTHLVETAFEKIRSGRLPITHDLTGLLLQCTDHINQLFDFAQYQQRPDQAAMVRGEQYLSKLRLFMAEPAATSGGSETSAAFHKQGSLDIVSETTVNEDPTSQTCQWSEQTSEQQTTAWHLSIGFAADTFRDGFEPMAMVRYLSSQVTILAEHWYVERIPPLSTTTTEALESCFLEVELLLSNCHEAQLLDAFEYIRNDCRFFLFAPERTPDNYQDVLRPLAHDLANELELRWRQLGWFPADPVLNPSTEHHLTDVATQSLLTAVVPLPEESLQRAGSTQAGKTVEQRVMRVPAAKLDQLVNQLGELVIATATMHEQAKLSGNQQLMESIAHVQNLVDDIQGSALQLRMVQIGETFNRFNRVVRDIAAELGKDIRLEINGAETELDKSMVERISDPLMHLVRNAMDHGLESPDERIASGKSSQGVLQLSAFHDSGSIVIEIRDDGRGINRERVKAKAIEKGLISSSAILSEHEIDALIFEPGFSTAEAISNLSGRGVGMDVVRKNIEALRGTVDIESTPGVGTIFSLRLPLTLAIIDGFMVSIGQAKFVIPLDLVTECIELPQMVSHTELEADCLNLRGDVLPFLHLDQVFAIEHTASERRSIVVVRYGNQKAGLVVDQLIGEFQTVIKPLGKLFQYIQGISGSSILGSGEIALILDIPKLINAHIAKKSQQINALKA